VESAVLDGPFRSGAKITTKPRGSDTINAQLEDVQEGRSAVVIIPVRGAALRSVWRFEDSGNRTTRITQQATIAGEKAQDYVSTVAPEMEKEIPKACNDLPRQSSSSPSVQS
jgi:hypothetical protein